MKNALLLVIGVGVGFLAAHQLSRTPRGQRFFADVNGKAREFREAVVDGYKEREAELRAAVSDADDVLSDLGRRAD
jgi:hypothetical protein